MRLDALAELDLANNVTVTVFSQNVIDLTQLPVALSLGDGEELEVAVTIDVAAVQPNGNETYEFDFIQSNAPSLGNGTKLVQMVIPFGTLVAGYIVHVPVPKNLITQRYIGMQYTLGGTAPNITVSSHLIPMKFAEQFINYPTGFAVS